MCNKLGDYIEFKNGLNYDKTHKGNGCKIVGVANFKNNLHINFENLDEVKSDIVSDDMLLKNDDLLFVRSNGNKSLVGRCLFVSDLQEKMSFSGFTIRARIKNKQKFLPKYFLYYATAPNFKNSLYKKIGDGTNIRNLTQAVLEDINIELPELDNQKKIANCLDQITQKIQLNNKINDELEKLAKTLYEYWFVQFDFPDENNRPYKSSGGKMIYNEKLKREIPENWTNGILSDISSTQTGYAFKSCDWKDKGHPVLTIKVIENNSINMSEASFIEKHQEKYSKYSVENGNIILAMTGNTIGKIGIIASDIKNILINQRVCIYKTDYSNIAYMYFNLLSEGIQNKIWQIGQNSSQPNISEEQLKQLPVVLPPNELLNKYNKIFSYSFERIVKNNIENQQLSKLRDFLLPMLMNGQVTIHQ